jgi:prevent-host-death family protein
MLTSTIDEAQSQLARLVSLVEKGEEIVIARAGEPVAKIVPYSRMEGPRQGGQWHGRVHIAPDFDELPPNVGDAFGLPGK